MGKKLFLSLFTVGVIVPFLVGSAVAYPPQLGKGEHSKKERPPHSYSDEEIRAVHKKMQDPEFMKMVQPMRNIGLDLFHALERGDIKAGQKSSKELASSIAELNDADVKKKLANVITIANMMSTAATYREMQTGYALIREEAGIFHAGRETRERPPRLVVDSTLYGTIGQAEKQVKQLMASLPKENTLAINAQIDTLMATLKTIKTPQLQDYVVPISTALTDMKKAKTVLEKASYKGVVSGRIHELAMVVRNK